MNGHDRYADGYPMRPAGQVRAVPPKPSPSRAPGALLPGRRAQAVSRNFGLALLVTGQNFVGTIASPTVLTYFVIQLIVANLLAQVLKRQQSLAAPKSHSAPAPTASKE